MPLFYVPLKRVSLRIEEIWYVIRHIKDTLHKNWECILWESSNKWKSLSLEDVYCSNTDTHSNGTFENCEELHTVAYNHRNNIGWVSQFVSYGRNISTRCSPRKELLRSLASQ